VKNKRILVTGGTGSFGKTAIKYLLKSDVKEVRVFSRDETKQDSMRTEYMNEPRLKFYIGDIRDYDSIFGALNGVDYVFHAAALKQVPSCEFFPMQAVQTNIIGSDNVIRASIAQGVKRVVCLSTDKAVYPINAMGISKSMMEKVAQSYARQENIETVISCVRYGNVMYSRGSVIPRFIEQIRNYRPITVTEPTMTRFLMALSESVDLVDHAFNHGRQGDIFIKKAPACTVADLAQAIKELFESDAEIKIIGIRHGEKLYETLASKEELVTAEDMGGYYRVQMDTRDLNYEKYFTDGNAEEINYDDYHSHNTEQLNVEQVKELLLTLPEVRKELGLVA
jgi:UDP-N-acetylglucosamine 4,6-dehydratase